MSTPDANPAPPTTPVLFRWRHVILSTYSSWLPGDPRGFRNKHHKIHSSGDYHHPPPPGEHAALHRYAQNNSGPTIIIPAHLRRPIGLSFLRHLRRLDLRTLALAVGPKHLHGLIYLPDDEDQIRQLIGRCKAACSHRVRISLPGRIWAKDGNFKPITDHDHQRRTYNYILDHIVEGAWVWSYKEGFPPGTNPHVYIYEPPL